MKIANSILIWAFLMFLCITQAQGKKLTEKEKCDQTLEIQITNVDGVKTVQKNKWCLIKAQIVFDCLIYTSDGDCKTCPPDSSVLNYQTMFDGSFFFGGSKGCVPFSQRTFLCQKYERICALNYKCVQCFIFYYWSTIVPLIENAEKLSSTCIPFEIPNCQEYTMIGEFPGCNKCKEGYRQYTGLFYYGDQLGHGKACPKDGSYLVDCQALALNAVTAEYFCKECPAEKPTKLSFKEGPISAMCIASPSEPLPSSCQSYKKYEEDLTKLECATCVLGAQLIEHVQIGLNTYANLCVSVLYVFPGCTQFLKTEDGVLCRSCDSRHDLLPFDSTKYPPPDYDTSIILGQCVLKSRFDLDLTQKKCQHYTFLTTSWLFVCEKCATQGEVSPCAQPKGSCRNGLDQVKISNNGVISSKCVDIRMDFCEIYQQSVSTTSCLKCQDGYELVAMLQHRLSPYFNKICIKKSYVIPGCYIYESLELNCLIYRNSVCILPESPPQLSICSKTVLVGYTHVCISCPVGYTLKNNSCLKSVQYCANLSSSGYCISCVQPQKYQLINNKKCVQRPKFCKSVKIDGSCELCEDGYDLNKIGNCTVSYKKTCPSYQYLNSQNECVPGTISNCLTYEKQGLSCVQCRPNYILSSDFKQCTPANKWVDLPPCPSDNKKFRYERNDRGECIAIDTQCLNFIKQNGYCYECDENSYAYQGLCYNIEFLGQGN